MDLAEAIKSRRKLLSISQADRAEMSEVSPATIKNIERGKGNPSIETLEKLFEVLGMEIVFKVKDPFEQH